MKYYIHHLFEKSELDLVVELDHKQQKAVSATTYATGRLLNATDLADLNESIADNVHFAGGWDNFVSTLTQAQREI